MQDTDTDHELGDQERQQVKEALEAILATDKFEAAPQMSAFLRYVVEQAVAGNQSRIKAFTVAVDALGKPDTFDPQNDPVVRVLAGRLRASLSAYNEEHSDAPIMITMTRGSYVPAFKRQEVAVDPATPDDTSNASTRQEATSDRPTRESAVPSEQSAASENLESVKQVSSEVAQQEVGGFRTSESIAGNETATRPGIDQSTEQGSAAPESIPARITNILRNSPRVAVAALIMAVVGAGALVSRSTQQNAPMIQAAAPSPASLSARSRPDGPALYVTAADQGDNLENSLNTLVSSIISEYDDISVYRILDQQQAPDFWPEDYILTLTALNLPDETRVSLQLMEAQTGRIIDSQTVILTEQASVQLNREELAELIEATRSIAMEEGPLLTHYAENHE